MNGNVMNGNRTHTVAPAWELLPSRHPFMTPGCGRLFTPLRAKHWGIPRKTRLRSVSNRPGRQDERTADRQWQQDVGAEFAGKCALCPASASESHHLIKRRHKQHRHEHLNGLPVCRPHHDLAETDDVAFVLKVLVVACLDKRVRARVDYVVNAPYRMLTNGWKQCADFYHEALGAIEPKKP